MVHFGTKTEILGPFEGNQAIFTVNVHCMENHNYLEIVLFVSRLNVPVNNFSVMSGRSQLFLGLTRL